MWTAIGIIAGMAISVAISTWISFKAIKYVAKILLESIQDSDETIFRTIEKMIDFEIETRKKGA